MVICPVLSLFYSIDSTKPKHSETSTLNSAPLCSYRVHDTVAAQVFLGVRTGQIVLV